MGHRAGFVSVIGRPNVGKSTLVNALVGQKISIATAKAQTTRHRVFGIKNTEDYQIVFSDTPGIIKPSYGLQESMMHFVDQSLEDGDVIFFVTDMHEQQLDEAILARLKKAQVPVLCVLNKVDLSNNQPQVQQRLVELQEQVPCDLVVPVAALHHYNLQSLLNWIVERLPESPAYYPKDQFTDRPERFFVSEAIREQIYIHYRQEIPYSVEVEVMSFKEEPDIIRISVEIYVARKTQKVILIGNGGKGLKRIGTAARRELERFFGKKIFLEQYVRVKDNWRDDDRMLKQFGYKDPN